MKLIIDIPEEEYFVIKHYGDIPLNKTYFTAMSIINGIPLEDIKKELQNMQKEYRIRHDYPRADMLGYTLLVIDKHMAGKER